MPRLSNFFFFFEPTAHDRTRTRRETERTWHETEDGNNASLNSEGLPNSGIEYYTDPETISESMGSNPDGKPYMVSVSGKTLDDNIRMLEMIAAANSARGEGEIRIAAVELNLACPNIIGKPIIAYDFDQMDEVLGRVASLPCVTDGTLPPLGVKMPPYFDGPHFERAADSLNRHKAVVKYAACINTIGNALAIDLAAEMPVISSKGGFAGLSGPAVKYTALANVRKMRELLDPEIDVIGAGGVRSGRDAFELLLCGASAVQVGTCHWTEGPQCFDRIAGELRDIMEGKGYKSLEDFRGKLREWSKEGAGVARKAKKEREERRRETVEVASKMKKSTGSGDQYMMLSIVLAAVIALLMADKMGVVSL